MLVNKVKALNKQRKHSSTVKLMEETRGGMHIKIKFNSVFPKIPDEHHRHRNETQERKRFPEREKVVNGLYHLAEEK